MGVTLLLLSVFQSKLALGYFLLSASAGGDASAGLVDALLVAEAVSAQFILYQTVKLVVGRERPYTHFGRDVGAAASDKNVSFCGGHAAFAFSIASASVTVASMRGYSGAAAVAGVGFALATGVCYLRIAADQHYLTDVLVGAAIGGLVGWAIPHLFHSGEDGRPGVLRLAPGGLAVAF
jgi:membrane-associated phospholipid phosphatase